jgi:hypothetical protein
LAEDTPEVDQLFVWLRTRYRAEHFELFAKAFALLLESTEHGYMDVLGEVFMTFTHPNPGLGQHMTPWNVCLAMSAMTIQNGAREVHERLNVTGSIFCPKRRDMLLIRPGQNMLPADS